VSTGKGQLEKEPVEKKSPGGRKWDYALLWGKRGRGKCIHQMKEHLLLNKKKKAVRRKTRRTFPEKNFLSSSNLGKGGGRRKSPREKGVIETARKKNRRGGKEGGGGGVFLPNLRNVGEPPCSSCGKKEGDLQCPKKEKRVQSKKPAAGTVRSPLRARKERGKGRGRGVFTHSRTEK